MDPSNLSGLALLRSAAEGGAPLASIAETMGIVSFEIEEGRAVMTGRADGRHLNPMGGVHGGFAATILDSVTGCAVHSCLPAGATYGTVDLSVKMMRPVPRDREVRAEGVVTHLSGSLGVADATLRDADGQLLASASATLFIRRPKSG